MKDKMSVWSTVLLLGTVWGFFEGSLGGFLHLSPVPIAGKIMTSIGFVIMFYGLKNGLKAKHVFAVSVIAATLKFSTSLFFLLPLFHIKIINPAQSIILQGLCFAAISHIFSDKLKSFKGIALTASMMFTMAFALSATFSFYVTNYVMGPLEGSFFMLLFHLAMGSVFTFAAMSLVHIMYEKMIFIHVSRLTFATRMITSVVLVIATFLINGF
jgi:hypothetical protein